MMSRTGEAGGAGRSRPGFTLIELMVVIVIIGVLSGILLPVLGRARESAKKRWAEKELAELGAVMAIYHQDQSTYPPDTADWGAVGGNAEDPANIDPRSIHRYLGRSVVNWKGEAHVAYFSMDSDRLSERDSDPDRVGFFLDPFLTPYHLDVMHMTPPPVSNPGQGYRQRGWPYLLAMPGTPTSQEKLKMVLDFKFISYGPDTRTISGGYPFDMGELKTPPVRVRPGLATDDVCSWE